MSEGVTMAKLDTILSSVGECGTWFWGIFEDFIEMILTNDLLLWPIVFAICAGVVGLAIAVIRRFGLKGRR